MPSSTFDVRTLIEKINTSSQELHSDTGEARRQGLDAARSLCFALETPGESILRHTWAEQGHHAAIRTAINLKVFEALSDELPRSSLELANATGADPYLMGRLLKHMSTMGTIFETGPNEYLATPLSKALREPIHQDTYRTMFEICGQAFLRLPEFLSQSQYKNPVNPVDGPFQFGNETKDHFFEWISKRPGRLTQFPNFMGGYRKGRPSWMDVDFYPVQEQLVKDASQAENSVFLVDVGGGKGHDLQELHHKQPELPGKLILQDLPDVIKEAQAIGLDSKIEPMGHDFFAEQPVIGARAYYMHSCLHDWRDSKAHNILMSLRPSLSKGYSKFLINENVIPDEHAHWVSTGLDMVMMAVFSAAERTEQDWKRLLESAGFKMSRIWTYEPGNEGVIEAEVAYDTLTTSGRCTSKEPEN